MDKIKTAFDHVKLTFPEVTHVYYNRIGQWFYCDDDFKGPDFDHRIQTDILEEAANEVYKDKGFPAAYRF